MFLFFLFSLIDTAHVNVKVSSYNYLCWGIDSLIWASSANETLYILPTIKSGEFEFHSIWISGNTSGLSVYYIPSSNNEKWNIPYVLLTSYTTDTTDTKSLSIPVIPYLRFAVKSNSTLTRTLWFYVNMYR